ncbi:hypothetical protein LCGC14_2174430 [marine sediment metagenome]|uniref:Uncharacterized protein n=1 Tax=marine sediment metagenome TaxID=412755 RepID=A0A0F9DP06_9ZZZZ
MTDSERSYVTDKDVELFRDAFGDHFTEAEWDYLAPEFRNMLNEMIEREVKKATVRKNVVPLAEYRARP